MTAPKRRLYRRPEVGGHLSVRLFHSDTDLQLHAPGLGTRACREPGDFAWRNGFPFRGGAGSGSATNRLQAGSYFPTKPEQAPGYRTHCE